jgi:gliding motility-associated-like protein
MTLRSITWLLVFLWGMFLPAAMSFSQACQDWYRDADGDGFGNSANIQNSCSPVAGYVTNRLDCNDNSLNNAVWTRFGPGAFSGGAVVKTQMAIGPDGTPYVVYRNFTADITVSSIGVKKFNGSAWVNLGTDPVSSTINMYNPSLAVDNSGAVYLAFLDFDDANDSNNKVTVMKYNTVTSAWETVGTRRFSGQTSLNAVINMAIDGNGVPYIAYSSATSEAVVMKYTAGTWQLVGAEGFAVIYNDELSIAIDANNVVYTGMIDDAVGGEASVMRYNGTAWEYVGGAGLSDNYVENVPRISFDNANIPFVLFYDGSSELMVRRFTGAAWQNVGTSTVYSGYLASSLDMEVDRFARPYVIYIDISTLQLFVKTLGAGNAWVDAAGGNYSAMDLSIAIAPDNIPYVSFRDFGSSERATVLSVTPEASVPTAPTVSVSKSTSCSAESITLSIGAASNLKDAAQWVWYSGSCTGTQVGTGTTVAVAPTGNITYYARAEGACLATPGICSNLAVTVNPRPAITAQPAATLRVCDQGNTTLSVTPGTGFDYQWYRDRNDGTGWTIMTGATAGTLNLNTVPTSMNNYQYRVEVKNVGTGCTTTSATAVLTVNANPTISLQPAATTTTCAGSTVNLGVTETGGGSYQWAQYQGGTWNAIPAATGTVLPLSNVAYAADNSQYRVTVSNATTTCSTISSTATLRVNVAPAITAEPVNVTACASNTANFQPTASGTNLVYQWQTDGGGGPWSNMAGETQANLQINNVNTSQTGYQYRLVVSNTGCTAVNSAASLLTVNEQPVITDDPLDVVACVGSDAVFDVTVNVSTALYQWQVNVGSGWADLGISSATSALALTGTTASLNTNQYRVVVSNPGCTSVTSTPALLTVNAASGIVDQPVDVTTCELGNASFAVHAVGSNLVYQWQINNGAGWNDLPGQTQNALALSGITPAQNTYQYRARITTDACPAIISAAALLRVNRKPVVATQPVSIAACEGTDTGFHTTADGTDISLQWQVNTGSGWTDIEDENGADLFLASVAASMQGYEYRVVAATLACEPTISAVATLTVNSGAAEGCGSLPLLISQGVSPNGDDKLDYWLIQGIEEYPSNTVKLYNIWGDLIFERNNYNNEANAWRGESGRGATLGGQRAPDGTYYYLIDLGNNSPVLRGFVVLKR